MTDPRYWTDRAYRARCDAEHRHARDLAADTLDPYAAGDDLLTYGDALAHGRAAPSIWHGANDRDREARAFAAIATYLPTPRKALGL